jgi:hypothetical protein
MKDIAEGKKSISSINGWLASQVKELDYGSPRKFLGQA